MLHNKLIEILDGQIAGSKAIGCKCIACDNAIALRAVVELHQPTPEGRYPNLLCQGCSMTEVNLYANYPCPTIQAIEKELS